MRRAWYRNIDIPLVAVWASLVVIGLIAIYSATRGPAAEFLLATVQQNFFRQSMWLGVSLAAFTAVLLLPVRVLRSSAFWIYAIAIILLIVTLFFGREVNGARRWLFIGGFGVQMGELAKVAALLAVARFMSLAPARAGSLRYAFAVGAFMAVPAVIVVLQNDTGTALPYLATIPLIMFWAGAPLKLLAVITAPVVAGYLALVQYGDPAPSYVLIFGALFTVAMLIATRDKWYTAAGFGLTAAFGMLVWFGITNVLRPHQVSRVIAFTNPEAYADTAGYHVIQSKLAIGQGGLTGRGFMEGTQTQMAFIPEQSTDFIYTVIGEEFGFIGAIVVLSLFAFLLIRLAMLGQKAGHPFARTFVAGACGILLTHIVINVGMTLGLMPIIGLPLPLVSYGGSALLANTLMIAIALSLYARREELSVYRG